jgi:hypothetical protein
MSVEAISIMRFRTVISVASFLVLWALIGFCAAPHPALAAVAESLSASGRIATVSSSKFTINLGLHQTPSKLDFVIDSDTKIEGTLVVGAQAAVDYRADGERLVATHVVVLPASGIKP